jgi:SAM-dependent methyltransferase
MKLVSLVASALVLTTAQVASAESTFEKEIRLFVEGLKVTEGSVVADIGAGDGEHAIALSPIVGAKGKIYATELAEEDRNDLESAAKEAEALNVEVAEAKFESTGLPTGCCDAVFLRTVYHHLTDPEPFARSLFETLRPGGRLMIIDFPPTFWLALFVPEGIPENRGGHGIPPEIMIAELEAAGFVRVETIEKWPTSNFVTRNYGVTFAKPARDLRAEP